MILLSLEKIVLWFY